MKFLLPQVTPVLGEITPASNKLLIFHSFFIQTIQLDRLVEVLRTVLRRPHYGILSELVMNRNHGNLRVSQEKFDN